MGEPQPPWAPVGPPAHPLADRARLGRGGTSRGAAAAARAPTSTSADSASSPPRRAAGAQALIRWYCRTSPPGSKPRPRRFWPPPTYTTSALAAATGARAGGGGEVPLRRRGSLCIDSTSARSPPQKTQAPHFSWLVWGAVRTNSSGRANADDGGVWLCWLAPLARLGQERQALDLGFTNKRSCAALRWLELWCASCSRSMPRSRYVVTPRGNSLARPFAAPVRALMKEDTCRRPPLGGGEAGAVGRGSGARYSLVVPMQDN